MADDITLHGKFVMKPELDQKFVDSMNVNGDSQNYENMQSFAQAASQSTDSLKNNSALMKEFGDVIPEIIKNLRFMNGVVAQTSSSLPAIKKTITSEDRRREQLAKDREGSALSAVNTGSNIFQNFANGNMGGMATSFFSGTNRLIDYGKDAAKTNDNKEMLKMLGVLGGGAFIASKIAEGVDTISQKYIDEMPTIYGTGRAFGLMNDVDAKRAYDTINKYNIGTNLNTQGFSELVQSLRQQGLGNSLLDDKAQMALAGGVAQTVGRWAYATGGNANQYASLAGMMSRYGGSTDVSGDFNRLVSAGYASGLSDSQIPEFLSGIQKVMEDGIAKGFTRSATEVAGTMLMFSKMSGNDAFWQGEQGAKMINQINAGISGATGLSKTSDIIAYRAISQAYKGKEAENLNGLYVDDGDYVNTMMLMEKGLTPENFGSIMGAIGDTTSSTTNQIEQIRQMFGLNYTGASRLLKLYRDTPNGVSESDITNITNAPDMQNNETQYQEAMNQIKQYVVGMGQGIAELKIQGMDLVVTGVNKITNWLGLGNNDKVFSDDTIVDNALTGASAEGAWAMNPDFKAKNKDQFSSFLLRKGDRGFGDLIFSKAGLASKNFVDYLYNNTDKENGNFRNRVAEWASDGMITAKEQGEIVKAINDLYELWKTELKNITVEEKTP